MSESDGEKAARSVALEQAYVHEVYEQCAEKTAQSRHWPRIYKFLEELEPGALVCDIGCGNGKYLSVNDNVFKVGADRCKRLTDIAREKENEVLICDNLALPFRDESFDAVLSIAVVHHFATTERRVNALKELARVLRIGGRLVISVWAMEQRHRKFESQDVLVPWPKAYYLNSESNSVCPGGKSSASGMPCINELDSDRIAQKCLLTSKRNGGRKCKNRSYWIDPIFSPSPSTSSLSSPNETCYSFFRRALQKLAGGKRGSGNRAWFLENWQNGGCKNRRNYESDDIGDVDDIPIELRRLEDDNVTFSKLPDALSIKSKSLGDILEIQRLDLVRSRSSIPGFSSTVTSELYLDEESKTPSPSPTPPPPPPPPLPSGPSGLHASTQHSSTERTRFDDPRIEPVAAPKAPADSLSRSFSSSNKPRLVKQKTHIPDDATLEFPEKPQNTAIREIIKDLADIQKVESLKERRRNVHKQSSMNEELMSMERLIERDRVRRNIMKQASLNEEIICKPSRTFGNFRDSLLYSGNATKRFQLIKSGLTNRIKQSTTSMEKVSGLAIKNGFVKILQGWTSGETHDDGVFSANDDKSNAEILENGKTRDKDLSPKVNKSLQQSVGGASNGNATGSSAGKTENEPIERRLSREDGSDSSKDSSLQSDTSVDSEDSFASVIYVPKQQQQQQQRVDYHHHYQQQSQQHHNRLHQQNSKHNHQNHHFPSLIDVATVPVGCYQLRTTSAPPSPRIKHPPDGHGPRLKFISISPLLKQFPATSKSLPPPSPPGLSPRNLNPFTDPRPFFPPSELPSFDSLSTIRPLKSPTDERNDCESTEEIVGREEDATSVEEVLERSEKVTETMIGGDETDEGNEEIEREEAVDEAQTNSRSLGSEVTVTIEEHGKTSVGADQCWIHNFGADAVDGSAATINSLEPKEKANPTAFIAKPSAAASVPNLDAAVGENTGDNQSERSSSESINDEDSRRTRLIQIKELLRQKPGFATRCAKSSFPLVRRASTATSGRLETIEARTLPRLLSLELYNPETDDLDSDSSGLSSPESVGSVISVISDERFTLKKDLAKPGEPAKPSEPSKPEPPTRTQVSTISEPTTRVEEDPRAASKSSDSSSSSVPRAQSLRLLEAAASVANSLQDTVGTAVIRLEPRQCRGRGYGHNNHGHTEAAEQPTAKGPNDAARGSRVSRVSRVSRERLDSMPEETRDENCQNENCPASLGDSIINDIERYCRSSRLLDESIGSSILASESTKTTIEDSPRQPETNRIDSSSMRSIPSFDPDPIDLLPGVNRLRSNCKYSQLVDDTIAWLRGATGPENDGYCEYSDNNEDPTCIDERSNDSQFRNVDDKPRRGKPDVSLRKSLSEDIMDFVMVSNTGECISMAVSVEIDGEEISAEAETSGASKFDVSLENSMILEKLEDSTAAIVDNETTASSESSADNKTDRETCVLRYGDSVESTEIEGSIGNSVSLLSDASQTESRFGKREGAGSTNSLGSSNLEYKTLRERRKYLYQKRSASEEVPARNSADGSRDDENSTTVEAARGDGAEAVGVRRGGERYSGSLRTPNLSGSSSQESLLSDRGGSGGGGGAITYHQYYHVFREGELDQLINKYVENLHIISSYYDHASWCIVAEKVQVWTI